jgi:hypothetical protein
MSCLRSFPEPCRPVAKLVERLAMFVRLFDKPRRPLPKPRFLPRKAIHPTKEASCVIRQPNFITQHVANIVREVSFLERQASFFIRQTHRGGSWSSPSRPTSFVFIRQARCSRAVHHNQQGRAALSACCWPIKRKCGQPVRSRRRVLVEIAGDGDIQAGGSIAVDDEGHVLLGGRIWSAVDMGTGSVTSQGKDDALVAKL